MILIFLHRQIGAVEHDGGAAPSDRVFHLLQACAVVEVDRDRLTGFFREFAEQGNQHFRLAVAEHAGIHLNDDGTFYEFRSLVDRDRRFIIRDIDRRDRHTLLPRRPEQFVECIKCHDFNLS